MRPDPARRVYRQAEQVVRRWHVGPQARWDQRRSSLGLSEQVISDDELLLVTYPEAVALAGLLASPYWLAQLPSNWRGAWGPFLRERGLPESIIFAVRRVGARGARDQLPLLTEAETSATFLASTRNPLAKPLRL